MRVHLQQPDIPSHAVTRVDQALQRYAPKSVQFVGKPDDADLVVLHVIGRRDRVALECARVRQRGQQYAIMQYVLRSTQLPSTGSWLDIWQGAALVYSYLNLPALQEQDCSRVYPFPFYHAPLGVDPVVFHPRFHTKLKYLICTNGRGWLTESVRECTKAAIELGAVAVHLGPDVHEWVNSHENLSDNALAVLYSSCAFVSGLRRTEGFELPAAEGLLCGSRPILFDAPHYRQWYDGLAIFIREGDRQSVIDQLRPIFVEHIEPPHRHRVTEAEIEEGKRRFDWSTIIRGFWEQLT